MNASTSVIEHRRTEHDLRQPESKTGYPALILSLNSSSLAFLSMFRPLVVSAARRFVVARRLLHAHSPFVASVGGTPVNFALALTTNPRCRASAGVPAL